MKLGRHQIAFMSRLSLKCTCEIYLKAPSEIREQPEMTAFNYLLDLHKTHRQLMKTRGLLTEEHHEPEER